MLTCTQTLFPPHKMGNYLSFFSPLSFFFSSMSCKWKNTLCSIVGPAFCTIFSSLRHLPILFHRRYILLHIFQNKKSESLFFVSYRKTFSEVHYFPNFSMHCFLFLKLQYLLYWIHCVGFIFVLFCLVFLTLNQ